VEATPSADRSVPGARAVDGDTVGGVTRLNLVILVVTVGFVVLVVEMVRRRNLREKYALLWLGVGVLVLLLSVFRPVLDRISLVLGIEYGPSTLFLFSTLFLVGVAAHLSWEVSRLEEKTRRLAEEIALMRPRPPATEAVQPD
jgi:hypothetical protein